jgi:hypothetical protein
VDDAISLVGGRIVQSRLAIGREVRPDQLTRDADRAKRAEHDFTVLPC